MKLITFKTTMLLALFLSLYSCRKDEQKERLFVKALQSKWNVDEIEYYGRPSGTTGTIKFTTKRADFESEFAVTNDFYEGSIELSDGTNEEFYYEYFQILSNNHMEVVMYSTAGTERTNYVTELMTKDIWVFYWGNAVTYYLSK